MDLSSAKIPFVPQQSDGAAVAGAPSVARNVVVDAAGCVRRRPGITTHAVAPSAAIHSAGIMGLHATVRGPVIAVGQADPMQVVYALDGGAVRTLTDRVFGTKRPVFAETQAILAIAAGSYPQKVLLGPALDTSLLGGAPPRCSHIIANNSRLLANDVVTNLNTITYSAGAAGSSYAGHEDWVGPESGEVQADSRPEPVIALLESVSEIAAFGASNAEFFAVDAALGYARVGTLEVGLLAPYSVLRLDRGFAWLDSARRFVVSDGRGAESLSGPIQQTLHDMATVDDCYGYRLQLGAVDGFVWTFPTDGRTFVYAGGGWSQWSAGSGLAPFSVTAHVRYGGVPLVGTAGGKVGQLSFGAATDLGEPVVGTIETGYQSHGTTARKHCNKIGISLRRGHGTGGVLLIEYRDADGPWSSPLAVEIGAGSDRELVVERRSLGVYRTRQWRATFSGVEDLQLAGVEEHFEVL